MSDLLGLYGILVIDVIEVIMVIMVIMLQNVLGAKSYSYQSYVVTSPPVSTALTLASTVNAIAWYQC